jgi:mono/diheme cytochrome c family protein|tara:strand:+ start:1009 stop:1413 length:405 start_codon:yes stop_codon:yes gene_type:complete
MKLMMKACLVACVAGVSLFGGCGGEGESSSAPAAAKKPSVNAMAVKGGLVFKKTCATCHGGDAKGMENNGPDLTASEFVRDTSADDLLTYVQVGREVPGGVPMPPRGGFTEEMLPDDDIVKVIAFLKNMPGNKP